MRITYYYQVVDAFFLKPNFFFYMLMNKKIGILSTIFLPTVEEKPFENFFELSFLGQKLCDLFSLNVQDLDCTY